MQNKMYDVGQGDSIKEGSGKVFSIKLKETVVDTLYPCHFSKPDKSKQPVQIPLGSFDKRVLDDYNGYMSVAEKYGTREDYEKVTQHTNAGEFSDMTLFVVVAIVCIFLLMVLFKK